MADPNAIVKEMTALRRDDLARYRAEIIDNVRTWHRKVLDDPDHGRMWGVPMPSRVWGHPTSQQVLQAVCEVMMPPCYAWHVHGGRDRPLLRITGYDERRSPVPPFYRPSHRRRGSEHFHSHVVDHGSY